MNNVDTLFFHVGDRPFLPRQFSQDFRRGVHIISDQHFITAIGLLGSGFAQLWTTTVLDFHTTLYLAWMSSMIHLSTMGILRGHFHKSQILQAWKLFSMMCLLVMMCIAIFPTSSYRWSSSAMVSGTPCLDWQPCDFRWWNDTVASLWDWAKVENPRKELAPQGVLSYMVLISAHLWQAVLLYKPAYITYKLI